MVAIPAGRFVMDVAPGEEEREALSDQFRNHSQPQRTVAVKSFSAGKFEITRGQYRVFAEATGRSSDGCFVWIGAGFEKDPTRESMQHLWLTTSTSPASVNVVSTTGNTPR